MAPFWPLWGQTIQEVLPELGFASAKPNACRDRRLQFGENQTVLVVEARNRKAQTYLRRFAHFRWNGLSPTLFICFIGLVDEMVSSPDCKSGSSRSCWFESSPIHIFYCTDGGMVDTGDLKSLGFAVVRVRVSLGVLFKKEFYYAEEIRIRPLRIYKY